jgi:sortase (surface protein transpeptidase)
MQSNMSNKLLRYCVYIFIAISSVVVFLFFNFGDQATLNNTEVKENSSVSTDTLGRSEPVRLIIPSIGLNSTFVSPLSIASDGTVTVPDNYSEVGWYGAGASPGEVGSAVILGHVDSIAGPAVFYDLKKLKPNDEIVIIRADGSVVKFLVEFFENYSQDKFPAELVYGYSQEPVLRLVTCSGYFSHVTQRYSHNLVVYANLKSIN